MSSRLRISPSITIFAIYAVVTAISLVFPLPLQAQITNVTDDTSTPIPGAGHNYLGELNEAVNPANGSVSLRLQVPVPPGRRLTVPFSFEYNTSGIQHPGGTAGHMSWGNDLGYLSKGGWSYAVPRISVIKDSKSVPHLPIRRGSRVNSAISSPTICFKIWRASGTRWGYQSERRTPTATGGSARPQV